MQPSIPLTRGNIYSILTIKSDRWTVWTSLLWLDSVVCVWTNAICRFLWSQFPSPVVFSIRHGRTTEIIAAHRSESSHRLSDDTQLSDVVNTPATATEDAIREVQSMHYCNRQLDVQEQTASQSKQAQVIWLGSRQQLAKMTSLPFPHLPIPFPTPSLSLSLLYGERGWTENIRKPYMLEGEFLSTLKLVWT